MPASMNRLVDLPQPEGPSKRDELAVLDRQVHIGDDLDFSEPLDDVAELDFRHRRQPFTPPIDICIR